MRMIINRIVDRQHVGETLETVIRNVIDRLADRFDGYRGMDTKSKSQFIKCIIKRWRDNRTQYLKVISGRF